jgi:hypothetical protein
MEVTEFMFFRGIVGARVVSIREVLDSLMTNVTDDECYELGYDSARRGLPINHYPLYLTEYQRALYQRGWDNFVNTH